MFLGAVVVKRKTSLALAALMEIKGKKPRHFFASKIFKLIPIL